MAVKTYDELAATGEIHKWSEAQDAQEIASGERFNRNERAAIEQANEAYRQAANDLGDFKKEWQDADITDLTIGA